MQEETPPEETQLEVSREAAAQSQLTRRAFVKGALVVVGGAGFGLTGLTFSGRGTPALAAAADKPTLYMVATSHIDSQWNWTVQHVIEHCIPNTMQPNWALFEKYPAYSFNFEGVIHYMWFKEYHPEAWPELQSWVKKGRWKLSGSWINAVDVVNPSPESLFRQALYGQQFFRQEFGQVSNDIYLPDCFGFPYSLPTIGRHSGLLSFSTQKFDLWGGWFPSPFSVGRWEGADGSELVTALRPGAYNHDVHTDAATSPQWSGDMANAGGKLVDLRYFGTGDQGGTPGDTTVSWVQRSVDDTHAPVRVINTSADQMAKDLTPDQIAGLPHYKGELTMKTHGVGGYTSQAAHKKWNRMNEQMADAAERASLAAVWLGGPAYPQRPLREAWIRVLWNQFHDTMPGTLTPQGYTFTWNDDLLSLNQFSQAMTTGVGAIAQHLDTRTSGVPLVVYNPLDQPRTDAVEAAVTLPHAAPHVRVFDTVTGAEVPSQTLSQSGLSAKIVFIAHAPSVGCRVYDVRPSAVPCALPTGLSASATKLESRRYRVGVSASGDISGVYDKEAKTELLSQPSQLEYLHDYSPNWPAWEILWDTDKNAPLGVIEDNAHVRVTEHGPARVALEVSRTQGETTWVQHIQLTPNGDWVEVQNDVDWQSPGTLVKASFPMTASNPIATFDLGLGTIERPNAEPNRYEVNAQQWADLTDTGGGHGTAVLTRFKYGWDKTSDNTLRLSLLRSPDGDNYPWQKTNDLGVHHFPYALAGHSGDWRTGNVVQQAARFNQPLSAFQTAKHRGSGSKEFSLLTVSTDQVGVRGLKKAEDSDEWVIRVQELHGQPVQGAAIAFTAPIVSVREIDATEEVVGHYAPQNGKLVLDLNGYQPRSFAVTLAPAPQKIAATVSAPITLPLNFAGVTSHGALDAGTFDGAGGGYPAELWPATVSSNGIDFTLAHGAKSMVSCAGQTIALPAGSHNRLYLLAASAHGDHSGVFAVHTAGGAAHKTTLKVQDWQALTGQWYSRVIHNDPAKPATFGPGTGYPDPNWDGNLIMAGMSVKNIRMGRATNIERLTPGFVKRDTVAWVGTHRHNADGNLPYCFCYLFQYALDLPAGATSVTLPNSPNIRIMAMTAAHTSIDQTRPAGVLYEPDPFPAITPRTPAPVEKRLPPGTVAFQLADTQAFDGTQEGFLKKDVPGLPYEGTDPWTINQFVYLNQQPEELTLIGGFGDAADTAGQERFLIKFHDGIHFWGSDVDVTTAVPFDISKWQMITLTFDGATLKIYKNGQVIKTSPVSLSDAASTVQIGTHGPWNNYQINGKVAGFTIWNSALDAAAVLAQMAHMPQ
jgi:alpha-mannosidase